MERGNISYGEGKIFPMGKGKCFTLRRRKHFPLGRGNCFPSGRGKRFPLGRGKCFPLGKGKRFPVYFNSSRFGSNFHPQTHELTAVIGTMQGNHKDKYDAVELVDGFVAWNSYQVDTDENIPMNKKWAAWIKTLTRSGRLDDYSLFIEFFG
jgi:hypothetical protein